MQVSQTIVLTVTMKKEGLDKHLILECETDGGYMSINHVGLEAMETPPDGAYTGPVSHYAVQGNGCAVDRPLEIWMRRCRIHSTTGLRNEASMMSLETI